MTGNNRYRGYRAGGRTASNYPARTASPGQIAHLSRLLADKELSGDPYLRLWSRIDAHELSISEPGAGEAMTSSDAGKAIKWIVAHHGDIEQSPVGVYRVKEGRRWRFFVIREFEPDDRPGEKVRYAKELVPLREGQGNRVSEDGKPVRYDEQPAKGWEWALRLDDLMEHADVVALSIRVGACVACHHTLRLEESQKRMLGPVCDGRQRMALAERDAARARALELATDAS